MIRCSTKNRLTVLNKQITLNFESQYNFIFIYYFSLDAHKFSWAIFMKNNVVKIVIFVRCVICFDKPIEVYRKDCTFLELILLI